MSAGLATVRSLFIPVGEDNLVLPSTTVAEIAPYREPEAPPSEAPGWFLGHVMWREQRLPVFAMEHLLHGETSPPTARSRIAVIKGLGNNPDLPYFGVVTRQIPRLVTVYEESIEVLAGADAIDSPAVSATVLANGEPAVIPDIEWVESQLLGLDNL